MECHRRQHLMLPLLFAASFLAPAVWTETVDCLNTVDDCTKGIGYSELLLLKSGDVVYCCAAGYSMIFGEGQPCFCNKTSDVVTCESGPEACNSSDTTNTRYSRAKNVTECCRQGLHMQVLRGRINGTDVDSCTCSSHPFSGYMMRSFKNGSDTFLHFVNYQGEPVDLKPLFLEQSSWIQRKMQEMDMAFRRLLQRLKGAFSLRWPF